MTRAALALASIALVAMLAACVGPEGDLGLGGASSTSAGSGGSGGVDPVQIAFPDLRALHAQAVAPTCALNDGVCHSEKAYPDLRRLADLVALVGAPCQLGAPDPALVLDACEVPGDRLVLGGVDDEILLVRTAPDEPFPPAKVLVDLASPPATLDPAGARIRRVDASGTEILSKSLAGATLADGGDAAHPNTIAIDLTSASEPGLADFLDPRAWHGDRVRMGDANGDGIAHASSSPWAEITPGDPARSFFYRRLVTDQYGARMPIVPRAWSANATRAVWCWIRGLSADATPASIDPSAPIDYADCPLDPDAPDPGGSGGWPAVRTLVGSRCATSGCHTPQARAGDLDLTPDAATFAAEVLGVASAQAPGALRVAPGQPSASYLLCKVTPDCGARAPGTSLMPLTGAPLGPDEIQTISDWIQAGAPVE